MKKDILTDNQLLCRLLCTEHEIQSTTSYDWDGLKRKDYPHCIMQYTISGEGLYENPNGSFPIFPCPMWVCLSTLEPHSLSVSFK